MRERLIIGGVSNANGERENARRGVCRKYGVGRINKACRDLIHCCQGHDLAYVISFINHTRRGSWFDLISNGWVFTWKIEIH